MAIEGSKAAVRSSGYWLKKVARISSWLLFLSVGVLFLSGWGITQTGVIYDVTFGLVDRRLANAIHRAAILPMAFFFLTHVFLNISLSVKSKRPLAKQILNWALLVTGGFVIGIVIYLEYFRLGG